MARRGTGRARRDEVLDAIEKADPPRHAALVELRRHNPQAFRRELAHVADAYGLKAPIRGAWVAPDEPRTPGRETDPDLRVGPAPIEGEVARAVRQIRASTEAKEPAKPARAKKKKDA